MAIQRFETTNERFEMRNSIGNHFAGDKDVTMNNQSEDSDYDEDEEDDDQKAKKKKKVADSTTTATSPRVQTRSDEARALVSFVLQHHDHDSCACYHGATSAARS